MPSKVEIPRMPRRSDPAELKILYSLQSSPELLFCTSWKRMTFDVFAQFWLLYTLMRL